MKLNILTPFLNGKPYHSKYSGYERLLSYLPKKNIFFTVNFKRASKILYPFRICRLFPKMYSSLIAEKRALEKGNKLFHLYGEDTFFLSGFKKYSKNKEIIVTFHKPITDFKRLMPIYWRRALESKKIITLCPTAYNFFRRELKKSKVYLMPHGIDINYFRPLQDNKKYIIAVGNHLRDYNTLVKAMKVVYSKNPKIKLIIISKKKSIPYDCPENIIIKENISDNQLLKLYNQSFFQILPLKSATANNALLEGMACGLPCVVTKLNDIKYYTNNKGCLYYNKGNYKQLAKIVLDLFESKKLNYKLRIEARKRAEELSWEKIAKRIEKEVIERNEY